MDIGELIALAAILVGILPSTVVFTWQMHSQNTRLETKIDAQGDDLRAEIRAVSDRVDALSDRLDGLRDRIGEYEQRNARLDGINETLSQILRQQSHTHESAD